MKYQKYIGVALCLCVVSSVWAGPITFQWRDKSFTTDIQVSLRYATDEAVSGGPFTVDLLQGRLVGSRYEGAMPVTSDVFQTWCVERGIMVQTNSRYYATIDDRAYSGGLGIFSNEGDPISDVTEWIYDNWNANEWTLQQVNQAIWYAEGEGGTKTAPYTDALTALGYGSDPGIDGLGAADHTGVLNLWRLIRTGNGWMGIDVQSHLISLESPIPAPSAIVLGSLGVGLVSWLRRRRFD